MNGLLVLDKPAGLTSHDVVALVRRATGESSVGHLGTLDPMATGVLPLLLGKYTRLAQFFSTSEKTYTGSIRFGFATDTYDADGAPASTPHPLTQSLDDLRRLAETFLGDQLQTPPIFSAKKINGVPAHKLARAGAPVPVKPARITVHSFHLTNLSPTPDGGALVGFEIRVSAGGYVRSVAHDLGALAGTGAHLASLRRTSAGPFTLASSINAEHLKSLAPKNPSDPSHRSDPTDPTDPATTALLNLLPHPRTLLPHMPSITVDDRTAGQLRNGMPSNLPEFSTAPLVKVFTGPTDLLCIARRIAGTLMQPTVVLG